jgi:hypothetical protein
MMKKILLTLSLGGLAAVVGCQTSAPQPFTSAPNTQPTGAIVRLETRPQQLIFTSQNETKTVQLVGIDTAGQVHTDLRKLNLQIGLSDPSKAQIVGNEFANGQQTLKVTSLGLPGTYTTLRAMNQEAQNVRVDTPVMITQKQANTIVVEDSSLVYVPQLAMDTNKRIALATPAQNVGVFTPSEVSGVYKPMKALGKGQNQFSVPYVLRGTSVLPNQHIVLNGSWGQVSNVLNRNGQQLITLTTAPRNKVFSKINYKNNYSQKLATPKPTGLRPQAVSSDCFQLSNIDSNFTLLKFTNELSVTPNLDVYQQEFDGYNEDTDQLYKIYKTGFKVSARGSIKANVEAYIGGIGQITCFVSFGTYHIPVPTPIPGFTPVINVEPGIELEPIWIRVRTGLAGRLAISYGCKIDAFFGVSVEYNENTGEFKWEKEDAPADFQAPSCEMPKVDFRSPSGLPFTTEPNFVGKIFNASGAYLAAKMGIDPVPPFLFLFAGPYIGLSYENMGWQLQEKADGNEVMWGLFAGVKVTRELLSISESVKNAIGNDLGLHQVLETWVGQAFLPLGHLRRKAEIDPERSQITVIENGGAESNYDVAKEGNLILNVDQFKANMSMAQLIFNITPKRVDEYQFGPLLPESFAKWGYLVLTDKDGNDRYQLPRKLVRTGSVALPRSDDDSYRQVVQIDDALCTRIQQRSGDSYALLHILVTDNILEAFNTDYYNNGTPLDMLEAVHYMTSIPITCSAKDDPEPEPAKKCELGVKLRVQDIGNGLTCDFGSRIVTVYHEYNGSVESSTIDTSRTGSFTLGTRTETSSFNCATVTWQYFTAPSLGELNIGSLLNYQMRNSCTGASESGEGKVWFQ